VLRRKGNLMFDRDDLRFGMGLGGEIIMSNALKKE
jgi:hypothetical protein